MSDARRGGASRALELLARHLEDYLDGDELAFETLGESLAQADLSAEDLQAAIVALRNTGAAGWVAFDGVPGRETLRVPGAHERRSLSPEAWGYLLDLRRRGALDPEQFEHVLERLTASGVRPVGVDLAREVAAHVALTAGDESVDGYGESENSH